MNRIRKFAILAVACLIALLAFHPAGRSRADLLVRKLTGQVTVIGWTEVAIRMLPGESLRAKVRKVAGPPSGHWVQKLEFGSNPDMGFQAHPIVEGPTTTMAALECHLSILQEGRSPHDR